MTPILQFCEITKHYGTVPVLRDISFTLPPGKIVGLLGPNGCGKSTVIKLAAGLLRPDAGQVTVDGFGPGLYTKSVVSYLPERSYLSDWMRVEHLLSLFSDFYRDFDRQCALRMLDDLSIPLRSRLKTLSKGTKEKVQLILVMSRRAKLYLLDEPIGGVDPASRDYILRTILQNYGEGSSVLMSTHLIQDVEMVFDQVLFLADGRILLQGDVDDIRTQRGKSIDALFREVFQC